MDFNTQRKLLNTASAGLVVCALGAGVWSVTGLDDAGKMAEVVSSQQSPAEVEQPKSNQSLGADYSIKLNRPLVDPPAAPPTKPTPAVRPPKPRNVNLDLTLVGTIIEPNDSIAMISDATGKVDIKRTGESLELSPQGVTIASIDDDKVTLKYNGNESVVKLEKSFKSRGGPGKRNRQNRSRN